MRRRLGLAVLLPGALLTGCSTEPAPPAVSSPAAVPFAVPSAPSDGPVPDDTAGPLTAQDMPPADRLGPGWEVAVDPGDAEAGYVGNGTPTLARDPAEVVALAVPLGCTRRSDLPLPRHALEQTYAAPASGAAGVAVRLRFADAASARRFHEDRSADLRACAAQRVAPGPGGAAPVRDVSRPDAATVRSVRVDPYGNPTTGTWVETATLDGADVLLVAVQG